MSDRGCCGNACPLRCCQQLLTCTALLSASASGALCLKLFMNLQRVHSNNTDRCRGGYGWMILPLLVAARATSQAWLVCRKQEPTLLLPCCCCSCCQAVLCGRGVTHRLMLRTRSLASSWFIKAINCNVMGKDESRNGRIHNQACVVKALGYVVAQQIVQLNQPGQMDPGHELVVPGLPWCRSDELTTPISPSAVLQVRYGPQIIFCCSVKGSWVHTAARQRLQE